MSTDKWWDKSINPIVGCTKISEGCKNCYSEKMAQRLKNMGQAKYQDVVDDWNWTGKIGVDVNAFCKLPKKPKTKNKVFVCSMGDLFHENVDFGLISRVIGRASLMPNYIFQILTKRPDRMALYFERMKTDADAVYQNFSAKDDRLHETAMMLRHGEYIPNLWLGVTAENQQRADERIPILLSIPAAVHFVSVEPMLSNINLVNMPMTYEDDHIFYGNALDGERFTSQYSSMGGFPKLDQVICGAETGPGKRPMELEWARDLRNQCKAAGVPFFFKKDSEGGVPEDLNIREFPR